MTDPKAQLRELAQQVAADPGGPRYPELSDSLIALGRYDEAVTVCERGVAATPRPEGYRSLAEALLLLHRPNDAFDAVEQALAGAHEDPRSLRLLGACHLALGRPDLAQPVLERSARLDPSDMVTLDLLTRTSIEASGGRAAATGAAAAGAAQGVAGAAPATAAPPPAAAPPAPAPAGAANAPTDPGTAAPWSVEGNADFGGDAAWSFEGTGVLVDGSQAAPGDPAAAGAPTSVPGGGTDLAPAEDGPDLEPLELDLGGPPPAPPAPTPEPAARPTTLPPPSRGAPPPRDRPRPTPPAGRRGRRAAPAAIPEGPAPDRRRQLVLGGVVLAGILLLVGAGYGIRAAVRHRHLSHDLARAQAAYARHDYAGYRAAEKALSAALTIAPKNPEALGLDAFVAARLFADFGAGTEALIRTQQRLTDAERLPVEPATALAARALLDLHAGRPGDVVLATGKGLADDPKSDELRWVQARAEYELQRPKMALSSLAALAKAGFLPAATSEAALQMRAGRTRAAAATLQAVLAKHPTYVPAVTALLDAAVAGHASSDGALAAAGRIQGNLKDLASPGEQCRIYLDEARLAVRAGRTADAAAAEDAARGVAAPPDCLADLGRELAWRGRPSAACETLASAANALDADAPARAAALRIAAVSAALDAGRAARASDILAKVPPDAMATALKARSQLAAGRTAPAASTLAALMRHHRPPAVALAVATDVALAAGQPAVARRDALRARRDARGRAGRLAAARALLAVGDARHAAWEADRALTHEKAPAYAALTLTGRIEVAAGHRDRGLALLERALAMNPRAPGAVDAYLALAPADRAESFLGHLPAPAGPALAALAALDAGDPSTAAALLSKASGKGGRLAVARARLDLVRGKDGALDRLGQLRDQDPEDLGALVAYADAALVTSNIGDAADAYEKALHRDPGLIRPRAGLAVAQVLGAATDAGAAATDTGRAQAWMARHGVEGPLAARVDAAHALACATISDGRCARKALKAADRADARDPEALVLAGRALAELGDYRGASARYQAAADRPGGAEGLLDLGLLAAAGHGSAAGGAADLKRFLASVPESARAGEARQALAKLK